MKRFVVLAVLIVACERATVPIMPPQKDVPASRAGGVATPDQAVQLIEYAVRMPQTLNAGPQSFHVQNVGSEIHGLVIEGNGVNAQLQSELSRGSTGHLEVNLPAGTYTAYCPVKGHRERGMETKITVR